MRAFLKKFGLVAGEVHGNFIPYGLRSPVVGSIFVVGDAAGQALPLTAEGIRKSLEYGSACGRTVQRVIDGKITLEQGLLEYRALVEESRQGYEVLESMQQGMQHMLVANKVPDILLNALADKAISESLQRAYLEI